MNCCKCNTIIYKDTAVSVTFSYVRPEGTGRIQAPAVKMEYCKKHGEVAIAKFEKEMKSKLLDKLKVG